MLVPFLLMQAFIIHASTLAPAAMSPTGASLSTLSSPIAVVSGTLDLGETKSFSFTVPEDLEDSIIHVVLAATASDSDRLDLTIDEQAWTDIQGDWWSILGSLTAGEHSVNATISQDAVNQLAFRVEVCEIPTPPFTVGGAFPSIPYNPIVELLVNVTTSGNYSVSATASSGNFAIFIEGYDEMDVSGQVEQTVQFPEVREYLVDVQDDILGTSEATTWSVTINPAEITTTSSTTTSASSSVSSTVTTTVTESSTSNETTSTTNATSATTTSASSSASSTLTSTVTESSTSNETTSTTNATSATTTSSEETTTQSAPPKCVVATATYGSEMAPEVVYMRFVRDQFIGSTPAGKVLVAGFNAFYYSWSPFLAREIAANEVLRATFRVLLLPLVVIVHATASAFTVLSGGTGNSNLASVLAFLLAAFATMIVYVVLPAFAATKLYQKGRRLPRILARVLLRVPRETRPV